MLVTGKGGVGKSLVAAATAKKLASQGKRVLLAEIGDKSFYKYWFNREIGYSAQEVGPNLWVCRWQGEECLKEYIAHLIKVEKIVDLFFDNKVMTALIQAAPALKELAILGKLTSGVRGIGPKLPYDLIIIDCYSTGHFKSLLLAPRGMKEAIPFGPMGEQCRSIEETLRDPQITSIWVVTLPEELPVNETLELNAFLTDEMQLQPSTVLNRLYPEILRESQIELGIERSQDESSFVGFLASKLAEQFEARKNLKPNLTLEVPFIPLVDPQELVEKVSNHLEISWPLF
ncbi:MAG: ArsA family ATPase [Bdellovibrionales bacterium]|nr:ArsA family ATPase [Bdellovibrionales bacterium]